MSWSWWVSTRAIWLLGCLLLFIISPLSMESSSVLAQSSNPVLAASPSSLSFTAVQGENPATKYIQIANSGGGTLSWSSTDPSGWLIAIASGTNSGTVPVAVFSSSLAPGTYSTTVTITVAGYPSQTKLVPVSLTVSSSSSTASPTISYSPTSLAFSGTVGGTNPAARSISISNTGGGTLSWIVSENAGWLSLNRTSGTNSGTVTASANVSGLAAGTYNGSITVTGTGATNTPRTIPVSLTMSSTTTTKRTATLSWTANAETDLAGYKIYVSRSRGSYGAPITSIGKTTSFTATGLSIGVTYYFVVTAYDTAGNESSYSGEVSKYVN